MAGELFFQYLQQLLGRQDSPDLADMLEVFSLALLLGFKGRYSATHGGDVQVLIRQLAEKIDRSRGLPGELSPRWRPSVGDIGKRRDAWVPRLAIVAAVTTSCSPWRSFSRRRSRSSRRAPTSRRKRHVSHVERDANAELERSEAIDENVAPGRSRSSSPTCSSRSSSCSCFKLHGARMWWMIGRLAMLGLISARLLLWFLRDTLQPVSPSSTGGSDRRHAGRGTRTARGVEARGASSASFGALPVLLVVGPTGATKTTTIVRSGLDPELLAGDVFRGETVAPTQAVNLWYRAEHRRCRGWRTAPLRRSVVASARSRAAAAQSPLGADRTRAGAAPRARLLRVRRVL